VPSEAFTVQQSMKTIATLLCLLAASVALWARQVPYWPYDKLTREADLIVIATPVSVRDTGQKTILPGIMQGTAGGGCEPIPAIEMETSFEVLATLKGVPRQVPIILYHLREAAPPKGIVVNGPSLVSFEPKEKRRYLLFLRREQDGRYVSLTGQTDPAGAVKDLGTCP
jgi:hypothetical protein